jgi:hypothetical protein
LVAADNLPAGLELDFRVSALRVGWWLGWAALVSVVVGIAVGADAGHRWLLLAFAGAAAAGNLAAMLVPWREWLGNGRGDALLDLWSGALIGFVALLVGVGGSSFSLLLFLAVPFVAVVQVGRRRVVWLATAVVACVLVTVVVSLPAGATAMRLAILAAVVGAKLRRVPRPRRAPSWSERSSPKQSTGSRTASRPPPTCFCSDDPTAARAGRSI